ncbi:MAG: SRPBCC family protein, partial [Candidatus Dormibacteraeota bacterium]|nr:SRPBCC family protein [Candidatus Dormibacteraeota bacterium]
MAERRFSARAVVDCTPEQAFDWVSDYRHAPSVLEGVTRWEPVGFKTRGAGARFDVEMRALGFPIGNRLVMDTWERPHALAWHSESGLIDQQGGWSFRPRGERTEVTLAIVYRPPAGQVGSMLAS